MVHDIQYKSKNPMYYRGRNGRGKQTGISVYLCADRVEIHPINSTGEFTASARLEIPLKDLPAFIEVLQHMAKQDGDKE